MGVMALFHLQKMFSFRYFLKKIGALDSYFIHRYILLNLNGWNMFGTMEIHLRHREFEPLRVNHGTSSGSKYR